MFFRKLKKDFPRLYWLLLAVCFLQIAFTGIKLEATPFLLYGMYSQKHQPADTVVLYQHYVNGKSMPYATLNHWQNDILLTTADNYYNQLQHNGVDPVDTRIKVKYPSLYNSYIFQRLKKSIMNDSAAVAAYPAWYITKLNQFVQKPVQQYQLQRQTYAVQTGGNTPKLIAVETVITY